MSKLEQAFAATRGKIAREMPMRAFPRYNPAGQKNRRMLAHAALVLVAAVLASGQQSSPPGQPQPTAGQQAPDPGPSRPGAGATPLAIPAASRTPESANAERRRELADDAARLLSLATGLKAEVDKTDKDTLSLAVIRKADEIEKLARTVKEKMKLSLGTN